MPRRDGTLTPEEQAAAQQAGQGPPPPETTGQLPPRDQALAALAATAAAARVADAAPPSVAPVVTVAAVNAAAAGILGSFDRFLDQRRRAQEPYVNGLLETEVPDLPENLRLQLVSDEMDAERQFSQKARARLDRDLPKALSIADSRIREAEVRKVLDRERRYTHQREQAMAMRTLGAAEQRHVENRSPEGGYWDLSPHVKEHTLDCLAMGGKVWPHSVLRTYHPPLHGGCPCALLTIQEAERQGKLTSPAQYATPDESLQAMSIAEAEFDAEAFADELAILEAFYDQRWGAGTTKAGQFRPKRGGDPGAVLRLHRLARMRIPSAEVASVRHVGRELDVRDLRVADLREGDHVMVNGNLEQVTKVHPNSPGLLELEHTGLAHIDREHIRGVPGESHPPEPKPADGHGLPELPTYGPQDRFELRHGANGSLVMWDREKNKPHAVWDHGWDLEAVKQGVEQDNAAHRQSLAKREPPPPSPTGGPSHEDVAKIARMRKPATAGELVAGVHYNPDLSRSGVQGEQLHLPPGFFKQSRVVREGVLFRHYGRQLTGALGDQGLAKLRQQEQHLASAKSVQDVYHALNTDARARMVDLHPESARLVAQAAHERGLPLHPEAAKLVRRPAAGDVSPAEHPAHALAKRQVGLGGAESQSMLGEAGYHYGGSQQNEAEGTVTHLFHNHDLGATIATTHKLDSPRAEITAARADMPATVPEDDAAHLAVGMEESMAIDRMRREGFSPGYTASGQWLRFIHPDGRGRALKIEGNKVSQAKAFTPTDKDVQDARNVVIRTSPLQAVKPGDSFDVVKSVLANTLHGWQMSGEGNPNTSKHLPDGVEGYAEFRNNSEPSTRRIVVHYKHDENGRKVIAAIGHGSLDPSENGRIVTQGEHEAQVQAHRAEHERKRQEEEQRRAEGAQAVKDAVASGDAKALKAALEGRDLNDAVRHLRDEHNFELRSRRRAGRGTARSITYTLRGPGGETLKLTGPHTFGHGGITKVALTGNPQGGKRERLPQGQAPRNLDQLLVDALGRADELGQRFDAGVHVTGIHQGGVSRGAAAHHEFNGSIAIRKNHEGAVISEYLKAHHAGGPLSEREHLNFYNAVQTLQHEINHGLGARGNGPGGLAFGPADYSGIGKNVEEALTEETAHTLAAEWLQSHGFTNVLAALKRNPQSYQALGTYQDYRIQLRRILDDAGIPEGERRALLERMKFQMTPAERNALLAEIAGTQHVTQAMHAEPRRRVEMRRNFEPILRPDLAHINAETPSFTTNLTNRVVREGESVSIPDGGTVLHGIVVAIRDDGMVKVRMPADGTEMWYSQDRVR